MGNAPPGGVGFQLRPGHAQQRATEPVLLPVHARQTRQARPANQVQQNGFRVVAGVVGGVKAFALPFRRRPAQKGIPQIPGGLLRGKPLPLGVFSHVLPAHGQGDSPGLAGLPDKFLVPVCRRAPEPVVEVGGNDLPAPLFAPRLQHVEQAHGIQAPGHSAKHPLSRLGQNRPGGPLQKFSPRRHSACPGWRTGCTPASSGAPPCRFPRGGSSPRYTPQYCAFPNPRCNSRPGTKTARCPHPAR